MTGCSMGFQNIRKVSVYFRFDLQALFVLFFHIKYEKTGKFFISPMLQKADVSI